MLYSLVIDSISKEFDGKSILSNIYLKCETGDILGIFGRNGSGKSTLLQIIFGILKAESCYVNVNGFVKNPSNKIIKDISYLPQDNFIPNNFSVLKAIRLSICNTKIEEFLNDDLIQKNLNKKISELSGGESKYLHVKLILYNDAKFCLLDEPYCGVSPIIVEKINKLIIEKSKLKGIIITDHNYQSLLQIVNKFVVLKDRTTYLLKEKKELVEYGYLNENMLN